MSVRVHLESFCGLRHLGRFKCRRLLAGDGPSESGPSLEPLQQLPGWSRVCFLAGLSKGGLGTFLSPRPAGCPCGFYTKVQTSPGQSQPHANLPPQLQPLLHLHLLMFQTHQTPPPCSPTHDVTVTPPAFPILFPCLCLSGAFASLVRILPSPSSYPIFFLV